MARKIYYKIFDNGRNTIADPEWEEVLRLQHWYNSEFVWTAGKLLFKMYVVFPNPEYEADEDRLWQRVIQRRKDLRKEGLSENAIIRILRSEGLVIVKEGGYYDECIASGFTRVAGNEWNALLVCDFLLKASTLLESATIEVFDEGHFIKTGHIRLRKGNVSILREHAGKESYYKRLLEHRRVFSLVDPLKYEHFPVFETMVQGFNAMDESKRRDILRDFHWLGFESNYDINGDDIQGTDLNKKVARFEVEDL